MRGIRGNDVRRCPDPLALRDSAWADITVRHDPAQQEICGDTLSLSPFAIFAPINQAPTLSLPASLVAEATSAAGASVTYSRDSARSRGRFDHAVVCAAERRHISAGRHLRHLLGH